MLRRTGETGGLVQVHAENGSDAIDLNVSDALSRGQTARVCTPPPGPNPPSRRPPGGRFIWRRGRSGQCSWCMSAASAVREIQEARMNGLPVFGETCVHYLTLTEEELHRPDDELGMYARRRCGTSMTRMCCGPRCASYRSADSWSTDHCPFNFCGQKELGREDFENTQWPADDRAPAAAAA